MNIIITVAMIAKVIIIMIMIIVNNGLCLLFKNLIPRFI